MDPRLATNCDQHASNNPLRVLVLKEISSLVSKVYDKYSILLISITFDNDIPYMVCQGLLRLYELVSIHPR